MGGIGTRLPAGHPHSTSAPGAGGAGRSGGTGGPLGCGMQARRHADDGRDIPLWPAEKAGVLHDDHEVQGHSRHQRQGDSATPKARGHPPGGTAAQGWGTALCGESEVDTPLGRAAPCSALDTQPRGPARPEWREAHRRSLPRPRRHPAAKGGWLDGKKGRLACRNCSATSAYAAKQRFFGIRCGYGTTRGRKPRAPEGKERSAQEKAATHAPKKSLPEEQRAITRRSANA